MFEKEAEEYARNKMGGKEFELITDDDVSKYEETQKDWQKGAEFGFQKGIKAKINTTNISDFPIKKEEAKIIIQDLLNNSDEYARQRAMDYLKEGE